MDITSRQSYLVRQHDLEASYCIIWNLFMHSRSPLPWEHRLSKCVVLPNVASTNWCFRLLYLHCIEIGGVQLWANRSRIIPQLFVLMSFCSCIVATRHFVPDMWTQRYEQNLTRIFSICHLPIPQWIALSLHKLVSSSILDGRMNQILSIKIWDRMVQACSSYAVIYLPPAAFILHPCWNSFILISRRMN